MKKSFVLDSNIVFSALLNTKSPIGKFIMSSNTDTVKFYAPEYLSIEIERYFPRIMKTSGMDEAETRRLLLALYDKIEFVSDQIIPFEFYAKSLQLVRDIDMDDLVFVALNEYLDSTLLWTGDKELYKGLVDKGYNKVVNFDGVKEIFNID
jgi:predicted nucleic acid-binding protein